MTIRVIYKFHNYYQLEKVVQEREYEKLLDPKFLRRCKCKMFGLPMDSIIIYGTLTHEEHRCYPMRENNN